MVSNLFWLGLHFDITNLWQPQSLSIRVITAVNQHTFYLSLIHIHERRRVQMFKIVWGVFKYIFKNNY